ncbi:hypothetical protein V493_04518 [Pseudogymnoascus sp. VKM F-4281 (FW-2241)]|nr:hypothetical protein V493_04518 [Pseudogymnoascus sp. VKM F-4281 (FW-2241)]
MSAHGGSGGQFEPVKEKQAQPLPGSEKAMKPTSESTALEGSEGFVEYVGSGKLKGKKVLITGGDSGIGRAVAIIFAREGADITIVFLPEEKEDAEDTKKSVEKEGKKCLLVAGDLMDKSNCKEAVDKHIKAYGEINVLVNNASKQVMCKDIAEIDLGDVESTFRSNILQMFAVTKYSLPHMKKGSAIINTTSTVAFRGTPEMVDYAATKGAIVSFTKSLAKQLMPKGIRVNAVAPGPVHTPLQPASRPAEQMEGFGKKSGIGRPGQPSEIAPSFVFLASKDINLNSPVPYVKPNETYRGNHPPRQRLQVQLRIASEPGQSKLVKALSNEFINYMADEKNSEPFSVAWISSNSAALFDHLASRSVDIAITHHVAAEDIAIKQGVADKSVSAWRDHWLLVGMFIIDRCPLVDQFTKIFIAATETAESPRPVRFLSRFDKSAANIRESSFWAAIGQVPWAHPHASWYHQYQDSPLGALEAASALSQYTLTERGTWSVLNDTARDKLEIFSGGVGTDDKLLLNPAHALVGRYSQNKEMANEFIGWLVSFNGGQRVIRGAEGGKEREQPKSPTARFAAPATPPATPPQLKWNYF